MSKYCLGIDVGGTQTKFCVVNEELEILKSGKIPTDSSVDVIEFLGSLVSDASRLFPELACVSLGLPGVVDAETGLVHTAPSIIRGSRYIARELSELAGLPVFAENDVACWAVAEGRIGNCRGVKDYLFVTLGTGIGCCIVADGKIYRGAHMAAGEVGYMVFPEDLGNGVKSADEFGAFESKVSAKAMVEDYSRLTGEKLSSKEMYCRFRDPEDEAARRFASDKFAYLSVGLADLIVILDPEKLVIAGGVTNEWEYLLSQIEPRIRRLINTRTELARSQTGEYGGALGAAIIAIDHLK